MKKTIWLSYDLGVKGDYEGLYEWLDDNGAKECGDSLAFFNYDIENEEELINKLKDDISKSVEINKRDRIYVIWRKKSKTKGKFIFGRRKANPWEGYGSLSTKEDEDF